jgi:DNA-binding FadR family transcriptional regulator
VSETTSGKNARLSARQRVDAVSPALVSLARERTPKAAEFLASDLRRRILADGLDEGTRLPSESEVMEQSGTSRATVREALRLLEVEGLIEVKRGPHGGVMVSHPKAAHVARSLALLLTLGDVTWGELFGFRELIEPAAAADAAANASDEQRAELLRLVDGEGQLGPGDRHRQFHVLLAAAGGNAMISLVMDAVEQSVGWFAEDEDVTEWDLPGAESAHRRVADAVIRGDSPAAEQAMRNHLKAFAARADELGFTALPLLPRSRWRSRNANRLA